MQLVLEVESGAKEANAKVEMGEPYDGYCFDITFRKVKAGDFDEEPKH